MRRKEKKSVFERGTIGLLTGTAVTACTNTGYVNAGEQTVFVFVMGAFFRIATNGGFAACRAGTAGIDHVARGRKCFATGKVGFFCVFTTDVDMACGAVAVAVIRTVCYTAFYGVGLVFHFKTLLSVILFPFLKKLFIVLSLLS